MVHGVHGDCRAHRHPRHQPGGSGHGGRAGSAGPGSGTDSGLRADLLQPATVRGHQLRWGLQGGGHQLGWPAGMRLYGMTFCPVRLLLGRTGFSFCYTYFMRVLGIDPGYGRMGIAVVEKSKTGEVLLLSDCIETSKDLSFAERLGKLAGGFEKVCKKWRPSQVALEKLFFTKNQKTAMQVAEVRGMILHLCQKRALSVREYSPQQVKVAVTGSGSASKNQVANMVTRILALKKNLKHDDEYDAIAIALTDIHTLP